MRLELTDTALWEAVDQLIVRSVYRYAIAIGCAVAASVLSGLAWIEFGGQFPAVTLLPAIVVSAWYGGRGPAIVTATLSALVIVGFRLLLG